MGIKTLLVLLFVVLFVPSAMVVGQEDVVLVCKNEVILSEIFPFTEEFVELYNTGIKKCSLNKWSISDELGSADSNKHRKYFENVEITAGGYAIISGNLYLNDDGDLVKLYDADNLEVQRKEYIKSSNKSNSYSFNGTDWDWMEKTPNRENKKEDEEEEDEEDEIIDTPEIYSDKIIINEIFPAPLKNSGLEEFVELYSSSDKIENLEGWYLKDRAGKNCALTGEIIDPVISKFLVIKNNAEKKCTLALNDTQGEFLGLYNPTDAVPVASVSYEGSAKKGRSYNFNGSAWSWSQFLTEGKKNVFNSQPYGKIKIDEDVFVNVYADFSVSSGDRDGDKIKISWDFGDGHKSSLAKTRHKYENVGTYNGSVKLSDGSEDVLQNFVVEVKKFPHLEVKIIAINANPAGADTGVEHITVQNKSKNKINLNGWSIATGWKDFINHPIREDVIIKKNKSKEITSVVSSFTLNNTKSKIQLRYPDGKVAHEVKYKYPNKSIADGEVYQKVKGGWAWAKPKQDTIIKKPASTREDDRSLASIQQDNSSSRSGSTRGGQDTNNPTAGRQETITKQQETNNNQDTNSNNQNNAPSSAHDYMGTFSQGEKGNLKKALEENKLLVSGGEDVEIELLKTTPRVLGSGTVREVDGIYFFTPQIQEKEHYASVFLKNIFSGLNLQLNNLLNFFYHATL